MNPTTADTRMADYYARRAAEYERVYAKPERQADLGAMQAWLAPIFDRRRVLEIACGTGWWTPHGARTAARWLATDLNPQTMAIARAKPAMPRSVEFRAMDAYAFDGLAGETFDGAFAAFWWSHVPRARLSPWLALLHAHLEPGAVVVMMDNHFVAGSSTPLARIDGEGNTWQTRHLDDGSTHEVLKNFPSRDEALAALGECAGDAHWVEWPHYWALRYQLT